MGLEQEGAQARMGVALAQPVQIDARLDLDLARGDLAGLAALELGERRADAVALLADCRERAASARRVGASRSRASPTPAAGAEAALAGNVRTRHPRQR